MSRSHFQASASLPILPVAVGAAIFAILFAEAATAGSNKFTSDFVGEKSFKTAGNNYFLPLTPGLFQVLETRNHRVRVLVTVTDRIRMIGGVETRIVTEREEKDGVLTEISQNYEAVSTKTNSVYYFGEDATQYKDGQVVGHRGSWHAGENGATFGMLMPAVPLLGAKFLQENALPIALDRSQIIEEHVTVDTPAGTLKNCLRVYDTDGLDPQAPPENKIYCHGIGNVVDETLTVVKFGQGGGQENPQL
jgi:hypothetical protein